MAAFKGYTCDYCGKESRAQDLPTWYGIDVDHDEEKRLRIHITGFDSESEFHLCSSRCVICKIELIFSEP